jgi:outer membrane protein
MKRVINYTSILFVLIFISSKISAQKKIEISVKHAVNIAFENVTELKNLRADSLLQWFRNKEIEGMAYPQISGTSSISHYLSLPLIQFPDASESAIYDVLNQNGVKDGSGNTIQKKDAFAVRNFSFAQPWNAQFGLSVNQLLFQPDVFIGLKARKTAMNFAKENIKVSEDKVKEQVYKAYFQIVIAEKQLQFLDKTIERLKKLEHDMNIMFQNGFAEKLDIDKVTVSLNNTQTTRTQIDNNIVLGYALLKQTLGLTQKDELVLTDTLSHNFVKENILTDGSFKYEDRAEIRLLNQAAELQKLDKQRYKLSYLPTIAMFYQFSQNGQANKSFASYTGKNWFWYNSSLIGLNMTIPIFDGFQKKNKIKQVDLNLLKVENNINNVKNLIDLEQVVSQSSLKNAILNIDVQQRNLDLAEKVYKTTKKKYEQGLGNSFEVLQTDTELQRSQSNYFEALYQAVVSKVSYLKALGKL